MPVGVTIKTRRGTAAEWSAANPTLAAGEPGYETDTGILKYGDGVTAYNMLSARVPTSQKTTRSATIVIAASDSSAKSKAQADYVCTGTNDHITINAAIATLPTTGNVTIPGASEVLEANQGGNILLLEGSYQIAGAIDVSGRSNVTIEGIGPATVIYNTATDGSHAIQAINTGAPKNRVVVKNLTVVGNALSGDGIHLREINYQKVEDVYCLSNGGNGISIIGDTEAGAAENKIITNVQCLYNKLDGLHIESIAMPAQCAIHETLISNSHFEENYRYNIGLINVIDLHLNNCSIEDCHGEYGLCSTYGNQLKISNCMIEDAISLGGASSDVLISNTSFTHLTTTSKLNGLKISNCNGALLNTSAGYLFISNSFMFFREAVTADDMYISSSYIYAQRDPTVITISNIASISGGLFKSEPNCSLLVSGTNGRISITSANIHAFRGTIGKSGSPTSVRVQISSNNIRSCTFTISAIDFLQMNDNLIVGSGSNTISNMTGVLQISNNLLSNHTITVDDTCSLSAKQLLNNLGGTVTDNSV
jgi:hypothetical protein